MRITNRPVLVNNVNLYDQIKFYDAYRQYEEMFRDILLASHGNVSIMGGWKCNNKIDVTIVYDSCTHSANTLLEVEIFLTHPVRHCIALIGVTFQMILSDLAYGDAAPYPSLVGTIINLDKPYLS